MTVEINCVRVRLDLDQGRAAPAGVQGRLVEQCPADAASHGIRQYPKVFKAGDVTALTDSAKPTIRSSAHDEGRISDNILGIDRQLGMPGSHPLVRITPVAFGRVGDAGQIGRHPGGQATQ